LAHSGRVHPPDELFFGRGEIENTVPTARVIADSDHQLTDKLINIDGFKPYSYWPGTIEKLFHQLIQAFDLTENDIVEGIWSITPQQLNRTRQTG